MKKLFIILVFIGMASYSHASIFFQPNPVDLDDLDHYQYYTWGIDWSIPDNEKIVSATLFFDNIRNHDTSANDLWVHLLDSVTSGVTEAYDNQGGGDYFAGNGVLLYHWHNLSATAQDITYTFDAAEILALNFYAADGNFGFGFDPDCHFYNDGITLTIETSHTPVPGALVLLGSGLLYLVGIRRK